MNLKLMGEMLRTEVVIVAANGLLIAVEDALEFQRRVVERTTYQVDPPTREKQLIQPVKIPRLGPVLWQHWILPPEEVHEEPPLPEVGAATAARAKAEVTMRASFENIARVKSE